MTNIGYKLVLTINPNDNTVARQNTRESQKVQRETLR